MQTPVVFRVDREGEVYATIPYSVGRSIGQRHKLSAYRPALRGRLRVVHCQEQTRNPRAVCLALARVDGHRLLSAQWCADNPPPCARQGDSMRYTWQGAPMIAPPDSALHRIPPRLAPPCYAPQFTSKVSRPAPCFLPRAPPCLLPARFLITTQGGETPRAEPARATGQRCPAPP